MTDKHEALNRTYHEAQSSMERLPGYYRWLYGKIAHSLHGRVVDLGCGAGHGIIYYQDRVNEIIAVDYNQRLLDRVSATYPEAQVKTVQADLREAWTFVATGSVDAVLMMDVIEHFEDDEHLMQRVSTLLKPGGIVAVKVPAHSSMYSTIDQASGHYRRYDRVDLQKLMERSGFKICFMNYMNPIGAFVYRMKKNKSTNFSRTFTPFQLKCINAAMPFLSVIDRLSLPMGLSLIGVFEKQS